MLANMCAITVLIQACGVFVCFNVNLINSVSYMQFPLLLKNDNVYHVKLFKL